MGVVYHSNYFIWFETGRTEFFKRAGVSYLDLESKGCFLVVTEAHCNYKAPATYDDEVEILTRLTQLKNLSLIFNYEARKGNTLLASGTTKHAFLDQSGKIVKIPAVPSEALTEKGVKKNG